MSTGEQKDQNAALNAKRQQLARLKLQKERLEAELNKQEAALEEESKATSQTPAPAPAPREPPARKPAAKQSPKPAPRRVAAAPLPTAAEIKEENVQPQPTEHRPPVKRPKPLPSQPVQASPAVASAAAVDDTPEENQAAETEAGEEEIEEYEEPLSRGFSIRSAPPWLVSTVVHVLIVMAMAMWTFSPPLDLNSTLVIANSIAENDQIEPEPFSTVEIEQPAPEPLEEIEVQQLDAISEMADPGEMNFSEVLADSPSNVTSEVEFTTDTMSEIGALFSGESNGMASVGDGLKAAASFFGTKTAGKSFVFVVDNSNSMTRGRFETALIELVRTVETMSPKQKFYVIFFSDTAYGLFHPSASNQMAPATDKNKQLLKQWLPTVEMCLRTVGEDAMKLAFQLNPDVIYILGDGAFTDKTGQKLTAPHNRKAVIHTLGMEVNAKGEKELMAIAAANGGQYRAVRASPLALQMSKQKPIPRNRTRGSVWGIKLPDN